MECGYLKRDNTICHNRTRNGFGGCKSHKNRAHLKPCIKCFEFPTRSKSGYCSHCSNKQITDACRELKKRNTNLEYIRNLFN